LRLEEVGSRTGRPASVPAVAVTDQPVVVTGASGFVGSHIVKELLDHGYRVRGTVRSPDRVRSEGHLTGLTGSERLELVAADLNEAGSYDQAMDGVEYLIHTASPYVVSVSDPKRDLIDPAVLGAASVLESAGAAGSVRRIIVTSSFAAVTDQPEGRYDESIWNTSSSLRRNPYYYSKVLAERAAWDFAAAHGGIRVISMNPTLVIGPSLVPSLNESNGVLAGYTTGQYPGIVSLRYGLVDVRDVATAHRLAMETDNASGRYLCTAGVWSMRQIVEFARGTGLNLARLPSIPLDNPIGNFVVIAAATFLRRGARSYLRTNIGRAFEIDTTKIRSELGMTFRPIEDAIVETYLDLRRWGHIDA
jgi:nucleoside-diphosphate-sugar epimerase